MFIDNIVKDLPLKVDQETELDSPFSLKEVLLNQDYQNFILFLLIGKLLKTMNRLKNLYGHGMFIILE